MSTALKLTGLLVAGVLCLSSASQADNTKADDAQTTPATPRVHKGKKTPPPPPLPSGPQGPVPQVPLDAMPAVAPQVSYSDGMLSIVAPNSTLGDILRGVRKYTAADIEVPATANERVVTRLGPAPARQVMAELLNGSHFNYILLGSPENANKLVRVVLVAKTGPDNPDATPAQAAKDAAQPAVAAGDTADADTPADEPAEDTVADQPAADADQSTPATPDQPGVKTPQQMLQEMQQRQIQMQQQLQQQQQNGQTPVYPPPGGVPPAPQRPQDQ